MLVSNSLLFLEHQDSIDYGLSLASCHRNIYCVYRLAQKPPVANADWTCVLSFSVDIVNCWRCAKNNAHQLCLLARCQRQTVILVLVLILTIVIFPGAQSTTMR